MNFLTVICLAAVSILLVGCKEAPQTRVRIFSTGQSALNDNSNLVYNYGGHSIRIDDGTAVLRMFRISNGNKTLEFEQLLDSSKHPMAWITPRVSGKDVEVEFGYSEQIGGSHRLGTISRVIFKSPHLVGSNTKHSSLTVEDEQKVLFQFWIMNEEGVDINAAEDGSENAMLNTSKTKPADFLLVTIASN